MLDAIFGAQILSFLLGLLKAGVAVLVLGFADQHVVEAIKTAITGASGKRVGDWAIIIALAVPAAVVYYFGVDVFKSLPLLTAYPELTSALTVAVSGAVAGFLHKQYQETHIGK